MGRATGKSLEQISLLGLNILARRIVEPPSKTLGGTVVL